MKWAVASTFLVVGVGCADLSKFLIGTPSGAKTSSAAPGQGGAKGASHSTSEGTPEVVGKQIEALRAHEREGRIGVALAGWHRITPVTEAQRAERDKKVVELAKELYLQQLVKMKVEPFADTPKEFQRDLGQLLPTLSRSGILLARDGAAATIAFNPGEVLTQKGAGTVSLEHRYPTGKREVPNSKYKSLQEKVAYSDKQVAYYQKAYNSNRCPRSGTPRSQVKYPSGDCAKTQYQSMEKYQRDAAAARRDLAGTKPTVVETVYSVHSYSAKKEELLVKQPIQVKVTFASGAEPLEKTLNVAKHFVAIQHAAEPRVGLRERTEAIPSDDGVAQQLSAERKAVLKGFFAGLQQDLVKEAGPRSDGKPAALAEDSFRRVYRRRHEGADVAYWGETERVLLDTVGKPLAPAPKLRSAVAVGENAVEWERLAELAKAEEAAGRFVSALLAWGAAPARVTPAHDAARMKSIERLRPRAEEQARLSLAVTSDPPELAEHLLSAFPEHVLVKAEAPAVTVTLSAARPVLQRLPPAKFLEERSYFTDAEEPNPEYERCQEAVDDEEANRMLRERCTRLLPTMKKTMMTRVQKMITVEGLRDEVVLTGEIGIVVKLPDGPPEGTKHTMKVRHSAEAVRHKAFPEAKIEAREEKIPADDELIAQWQRSAGGRLRDVVLLVMRQGAASPGENLQRFALHVLRQAYRPGERMKFPGLFFTTLTSVCRELLGHVPEEPALAELLPYYGKEAPKPKPPSPEAPPAVSPGGT